MKYLKEEMTPAQVRLAEWYIHKLIVRGLYPEGLPATFVWVTFSG